MARVLGITLVAALAACSSPNTFKPPPPTDHGSHAGGDLADDDAYQPTYGKPELEHALSAERAQEAAAERTVSDLATSGGDAEQVRADLAVRRRFIASLEACEASGRTCPPRLDDPPFSFEVDGDKPPPLEAALRFDLEDWQKVTAELHGRACACRTLACVDGLEVAIAQLESRPTTEVQADDTAILAVTRARECLFRLRGRAPAPPHRLEDN